MKKTDHDFLELFQTDSNAAMDELIEQYTGLVWSIASKHLSNTEDKKECVNDTFAEFYRRWETFDPSKGTLSAYLSTIAQNRAITKYQKNKVYNLHDPLDEAYHADSFDAIDQAEWKIVLASAMEVLSADEVKLIQMKYYENMTVKEIADALHIPYETVKKRHQRTIGKLKKALIGLLIFVLISVLAACAYMVLRYFGVVPGYGINVSENAAVYVLEEMVAGESAETSYTVEDAFLLNGTLQVKLTTPVAENDFVDIAYPSELYIDDILYTPHSQSFDTLTPGKKTISFVYYGISVLDRTRDAIDVKFSYDEAFMPFTLIQADESQTDAFSTEIIDGRGLLAIPKLMDENLTIEIHPLNQESISILPALVNCIYDELDTDVGPVTLIDADGTSISGQRIGYSPFSSAAYYNWTFGEVAPGTYTLHVPYLYETVQLPEDFAIPFDMINGVDTETIYDIPGGTLRAVSCEPVDPDKIPSHPALQIMPLPNTDYWVATLEYTNARENFRLLGFSFNATADFSDSSESESAGIGVVLAPEPNQISYLLNRSHDGKDVSVFTLTPSQFKEPLIYRRWMQEFDLTIEVK